MRQVTGNKFFAALGVDVDWPVPQLHSGEGFATNKTVNRTKMFRVKRFGPIGQLYEEWSRTAANLQRFQ
jgi:hypothetical protein